MKRPDLINQKILSRDQLVYRIAAWRLLGHTVSFTNGVFDILHPGHLQSLSAAAAEADRLIVGINSDASVKRLKGDDRPVNNENTRSLIIASLQIVDAVTIFDDDTPLELIKSLLPDVIVKGGDYSVDQVAGAKEVIANGGRVVINPILEGHSTTLLISKLKT